MSDAICSNRSLVEGGFDLSPSECIFCCQKTVQKAGYVGIYCPNCKNILSGDEWAGQIARVRRELLGLTKRQLGEKIGKSKHTIHYYENKKCPEVYLDKLKVLLSEKYKSEA